METAGTAMLPEEFILRMKEMLGEEFPAFLAAYEQEEIRALRFQTGKRTYQKENSSRILRALGCGDPVSFVPWEEDAWILPAGCKPGRALWHDLGAYYVQEPSAMSAAALLAPEPGERVLDLCAAPGGKTVQLASRMRGEGLLVSNEIHPARCRILSRNVERMGIGNCLVTNEAPDALAARFPAYFDRILVDAPCSGEGMFRKNPEAYAEWSPEAVRGCAGRQLEILGQAARMLKPGGRLAYSTCTFSPEENEGTIGRFLETHPSFSLLPVDTPWFSDAVPAWGNGDPHLALAKRLWPQRLRGEGHFAALLQKEDAGEEAPADAVPAGRKKERKNAAESGLRPDKKRRQQLEDFRKDLLAAGLPEGETICFGEQVFLLPGGCPSLAGLRVLRPGLQLGTFQRDRLEPAHALAPWLIPEEAARRAELTPEDPRAEAWLRGEGFAWEGPSGWTLVCIDGLGAGWGKMAGGQMKNHLPKGLRRSW